MANLSGSVGTFGRNLSQDVMTVQTLLASHGQSPGPIDGRCGRRTVAAIFDMQRGLLPQPDGRVDVGGPTWRRLNTPVAPAASAGPTPPRPVAPPTPPPMATQPRVAATPPAAGGDTSYKRPVPAPPPGTVNVGLICPSSAWMVGKLGKPRETFSQQCQDMTNKKLAAMIEVRTIGHNHFRGLKPALDSLEQVMTTIAQKLPDLYPHIGSGGMLCCRNIRGYTDAISNHSWGTAVDIAIDGQIEPLGPSKPYLGLSLIAPFFNQFGWYWGGGYTGRKDCMHFECGQALVETFAAAVA